MQRAAFLANVARALSKKRHAGSEAVRSVVRKSCHWPTSSHFQSTIVNQAAMSIFRSFSINPRRRHEVLRNIVQDALESVEHAHQAIGVMRVVSYSLRGLLVGVDRKEVEEFLLGVAFLALPAIDSTIRRSQPLLFLTIFPGPIG